MVWLKKTTEEIDYWPPESREITRYGMVHVTIIAMVIVM